MKKKKAVAATLRQSLVYEPVELAFGTSGLRGLVSDMTSLEVYAAVRGFLAWLEEKGEAAPGSPVYIAGDLRPSTADIMPAAGRGAADAGFVAVPLGRIPTPALVLYAMKRAAPGIMVTGSHIPFDRNGIKLTRPSGEVLKDDEARIIESIRKARDREYARPFPDSIFDERGMLRQEHAPTPAVENAEPGAQYVARFTSAFPPGALTGRKILVWRHSAVGRDLLARTLADLGADVVPAGSSESFVAVDTEAVNEQMLQTIQGLVDAHGGQAIEAVASTDGDGDRPLLLAVDAGRVRFIPGDLLGLAAAEYLGARHVVVPVSANDAVELHLRARGIEPVKTMIGSPYLIAALKEVGWECNGGFLTAAAVQVPGGGTLEPLPTRDAMLPILCALCASLGTGKKLSSLLEAFPRRFGSSAVLREFPLDRGRQILGWFSPRDSSVLSASFDHPGVRLMGRDGAERSVDPGDPFAEDLEAIRARIGRYFTAADGFTEVAWVNWMDGMRVGFTNGDVAHIRPSGNAPEMRFYANAATQDRAEAIAKIGISTEGIVRRMERDAVERIAIEGYRLSPQPVELHGVVQHYEWGGFELIPGLLGEENAARRPFAELWMGTHPRGTALAAVDGARIPLDRLIAADPLRTLGEEVALQFAGRLPYLFKVLDARTMASIQAHPSKAQAGEGFARENAAGIPLDAPQRNYRDENHKPEVHAALTDFWMLHGFKPLEEISEILGSEEAFAGLMPAFDERLRAAEGDPDARAALLRDLYARVMSMPQPQVDALLDPLVGRLEAEEARGALGKDAPGYWALLAARTFAVPGGHRDRGIFSIYLLNLVRLKPGQGTFQPAGTLHCYLEGANVELMANSDNVLRGGLTTKHIDAPELLGTLCFKDGKPRILEGRATSETSREYETPAAEFALERIEIAPGTPHAGGREHSADSLIVIEGAAAVLAGGRTLLLSRGGIALVPAGLAYSVAARSPRAVLFKAGVPRPP